MRQALRLAESIARPTSRGSWNQTTIQLREHCDVLRAALAEPVVKDCLTTEPAAEPVAWVYRGGPFPRYDTQQYFRGIGGDWVVGEPLYASPQPPAKVPLLTDREIRTIFLAYTGANAHSFPYLTAYLESAAHLVRQVEQAVRQKAGL